METVRVRLKEAPGIVQELYAVTARGFVATGAWEYVTPQPSPSAPPEIKGVPTMDCAAIMPPQETAVVGRVIFKVGPRSPRNATLG